MPTETHNTTIERETDEERDAIRRGVVDPPESKVKLKRDKDFETHDDDVRLMIGYVLSQGACSEEVREAARRCLGEVKGATVGEVTRAQGLVDARRIKADADEAAAKVAEDEAKAYEEDTEKFASGKSPVTPEDAARMRRAKLARAEK